VLSIDEVTTGAAEGSLEPVYLLVGVERLLIERAVDAVRKAVDQSGTPGFNVDLFDGKGLEAASVISAAGTLPMMADRRFVLVRRVDAMTPTEQSNLAEYLTDPNDSTSLVLTADKLDGRGKLAKVAKKQGCLIDAKPMRGRELRAFIRAEATARGHNIAPRIVARMREALSEGLRPQEAAKRAGAPPFKASDLTTSARQFTADTLGEAFTLIARTDMALKSSKRPPDAVLQDAVLELCTLSPRAC
jgi:DNA polymerase III delta subunit